MSGPWEKYAPAESGPWAKYQTEAEAPASKGPTTRPTNPLRGQSSGRLAATGARQFVEDASLALSQRLTELASSFGIGGAQEEAARLRNIADTRKLDPVRRTTAGQVGYGAAALVPAVGAAFVPGVNTVVGSGLVGAGMGALQPTGKDDSALLNAAEGAAWGAGGQVAANTVARVARPIKQALGPAEQKAVRVLKQEGVPLSAAQQTGSPRAQQVERFLADNPVTQPAMEKAFRKRQAAFTRAVVRTFGENADNAGPEVLERAATRIGRGMDDFASRYKPDFNDVRLTQEIADIEAEVGRLRVPAGDNRVTVQIERIRNLSPNGIMDGKSYQSVRRELAKLARDPDAGEYAYRLQEVLDDALQRAAGSRGGEIKKLRSQWRNLRAVEAVADTTERAQVSGPALAQHLKSSKFTRNSFRYGRGDAELSRLARGMSTVVDRFPQSGTAPRAGAQLVLPAVAGAGGAIFGEGSPEERAINAAKWAAAGYLVPRVGAAAMTRPGFANYLAGADSGLVRNALALPSRAGVGALLPAYMLAQP